MISEAPEFSRFLFPNRKAGEQYDILPPWRFINRLIYLFSCFALFPGKEKSLLLPFLLKVSRVELFPGPEIPSTDIGGQSWHGTGASPPLK
jgi:hypothetical protein